MAFNSGFDLANMADTVWQTSQGHFFSLTGANGLISRFTIHTDIILVLLVPLYKLYTSPNVLLMVQAFAIGVSVIPIYLITKKILKNNFFGILIATVFLLSPNTLWANVYDFHPVVLAIPLLFFAIYFLLEKKWLGMWIMIGLSLLTKENVGAFVAMLGLIAFFKYKEHKIGIALFLIGVSFSLIAIKVVMPLFANGQQHWALSWYNFSPGLITRVWNSLTNADAIAYYRDLLVPYGFLPILAIPWLLPAFPDIFINLTSEHPEMRSLIYHYQSLTIIMLTISLIMALYYLRHHHTIRIIAVIALLFCAIRQNYLYSPLPTSTIPWQNMYQIDSQERDFEKALEKIPKQATVAASAEVRPHVIDHPLSYNLPDGASQVDYIAMISRSRLLTDTSPKPYETQLIASLKNNPHYLVLYESEPYYLFQKLN